MAVNCRKCNSRFVPLTDTESICSGCGTTTKDVMVTKTCPVCNFVFRIYESYARTVTCCSRQCRSIYMKSCDSDRFWKHVNKSNGCWEWTKSLNDAGYGKFRVNGKSVRAHRYSYELVNGPIPKGFFACHHCDNRKCVRPDHLFLGKAVDNTNDMMSKGRYVGNIHRKNMKRGESHPYAILSESQVREIRQQRQDGMSLQALAATFGVCRRTISDVIDRKTWKHVE